MSKNPLDLNQYAVPNEPAKKPAGRKSSGAGLRGGTLKAPPIMVYPSTMEQRERIVRAAHQDGRSLSYFLLQCAEAFLNAQDEKERMAS